MKANNHKVIILGGGVAGMSAAHELAERGFTVEVFEQHPLPGGKARSLPVPDSATGGRQPLPGEHGFRFFPRFYKHVTDTMKRIPTGNGKHSAFDNLVDTTRVLVARYDLPPVDMVSRFPRSLDDLKTIITGFYNADLGIPPEELHFFAERVWQLMTSCAERRGEEYEMMGWWEFIGAETRSKNYQDFFGFGITRSLVAAKADLASTKTVGDIYLQLMFDILEPGVSSDRVLNAPTNEAWIEPWLRHLESLGVRYHLNSTVKEIQCADGKIQGAVVSQEGSDLTVTGDYYIACMPVEVMAKLLTDSMIAADPTLANIRKLAPNVSWMNGIQFYLRDDVPLAHGHGLYINSTWALTSISQAQFWNTTDLAQYGDGTVRGVLSVDISEWEKPGLNGKTAKECTREEIKNEVWAEIKKSINIGTELLKDENLHSWFLDEDIVFFQDPNDPDPIKKENHEPLLVNLIGTWKLRPNAYTGIPNFFLASDYVKTYTDLATMEGANEAARRAVNAVIDASRAHASLCKLWKLHEPDLLMPWRNHDKTRYDQGLPWDGKVLG